MPVGGSIESISLAGRVFSVAADADTQRNLGGKSTEFQPNGDGTGRYVQTQMGWSITGLQLSIDDDRGDDEYLKDLRNRPDPFPVVVTYASGVVYQGVGKQVGDPSTASQATTAAVDLMGPGELTKQ